MCRVPNSARMLLPADAQPQLRPTPLEEEGEIKSEDKRRERESDSTVLYERVMKVLNGS